MAIQVAVKWGADSGLYRARVVKIDDESGKVRLHFVDYGNTLTVPIKRYDNNRNEDDGDCVLRRLPPELLYRKFRAVECHLADVVPTSTTMATDELNVEQDVKGCHVDGGDGRGVVSGNYSQNVVGARSSGGGAHDKGLTSLKKPKWSREAREYFVDLVRGKLLVVHVKSLMMEGEPVVDLWDTSPGLNLADNVNMRMGTAAVPDVDACIDNSGSLSASNLPSSSASDVLVNESLVRLGFGRYSVAAPSNPVVAAV